MAKKNKTKQTVKEQQQGAADTNKKKKNQTKESAESQSLSLPQNLLLDHDKDSSGRRAVAHLHVDVLFPDAVFVCKNFFTAQECQHWIDHVENIGFAPLSQKGTRYLAQRECGRFQRNDSSMADRIFSRIQQYILPHLPSFGFPPNYQPTTCNPNLRLYKYEQNMSFGKHYDGSDEVKGVGCTEMTVLIYLSDFVGGAARFYAPDNKTSVAFEPTRGAILLHIHGDKCLAHEAEPVVSGVKYVLRTDLVYSEIVK